MNKRIFIIVICIITALCSVYLISTLKKSNNDNDNKIHLSDKYYNKGNYIEIKSSDLYKLKKENYILFTYNNYCNMPISCEDIFLEFMEKYKIDFLSIPFDEFKKTDFYKTVKYAPSIIIVSQGNIIAYLDADSDDDFAKYQDVTEFKKWLSEYISLK